MTDGTSSMMRHRSRSVSRLAVFLPGLFGGGAERAMLNLATGIARHGYHVDLVLASATGPYLGDVPSSVRLIDLSARRTAASLPALVRYMRKERPAAMVSALSRANIVSLIGRRITGLPFPLIVNEQNTLSQWIRRAGDWRTRLTPHVVKRCYPWANALVGVSDGVVQDLRGLGVRARRLETIYNPVITPEFERRAAAPLDHPWFDSGQPPVLVAVGSLTPQKDFSTLLRAFAQLRTERPARLIILGEGAERRDLETLSRALRLDDDVDLPGFVRNPIPFVKRAAAFVLSSRWEGLPTVVIEALYCGVPIVSTNCPSGPREILRGGRYGLLVPVGDPERLSRALKAALAGSAPQVPLEAWRPYELDAIVSSYLRLLFPDQR